MTRGRQRTVLRDRRGARAPLRGHDISDRRSGPGARSPLRCGTHHAAVAAAGARGRRGPSGLAPPRRATAQVRGARPGSREPRCLVSAGERPAGDGRDQTEAAVSAVRRRHDLTFRGRDHTLPQMGRYLESHKGKAPGGYQSAMDERWVPFIFDGDGAAGHALAGGLLSEPGRRPARRVRAVRARGVPLYLGGHDRRLPALAVQASRPQPRRTPRRLRAQADHAAALRDYREALGL